MSWSAVLIDVQTGKLGRTLAGLDGSGSIEEPLNDVPSMTSLTVPKPALRGLVPWRDGAAIMYGDTVVLAGPITNLPQRETRDNASVPVAGIESVLDGWLILGGAEHSTGEGLRSAPPTVITAGSLGTVQWLLVEQAMRRCGSLPIVHGTSSESGTGVAQEFPAWRLASNGLLASIYRIAEGVGPDVAFWPRLAGSGDRVEWVMVHGTAAQPTLAQTHVPVIDLTAERSGVAAITPSADWRTMATRIYGVGAGQEAGQLVSMAYAHQVRQLRVPVREVVTSHTDVNDWPELQRIVDGEAAAAAVSARQLDLELEAAHPHVGLAAWRPGQVAQVTVGPDWLSVPAGSRQWRMLSRSVRPGASTYLAKVQEEA